MVFLLIRSNVFKMAMASSVFPFDTSHRADSGIIHGTKTVTSIGAEVAITNSLQSLIQRASNGIDTIPDVKKKAMDMFATKVRLDGPTYSRTAKMFH